MFPKSENGHWKDYSSKFSFFRFGNQDRKNSRRESYALTPPPENPFLVTAINFYSFLFAFPYRIVRSKETGEFVAETSALPKAFCFLLHFSVLASVFLFVYPTLQFFYKLKTSVIILFLIIYMLGFVIGTAIVIKIAWFNKRGILELCNLTAVSLDVTNPRRIRVYKVLICTCTAITIILHTLQGIYSPPRYFGAIRSYRIAESIVSPVFEYIGFSPVKFLLDIFGEYALKNIALVFYSYFCCFIHLPVHIFLVLALTCWYLVTDGLQKSVIDRCTDDEITTEYRKVKAAMIKLREVFGGFILCYYIEALSFYAQLPHFFIYPNNALIENIQLYNYLCVIGFSMYLAMRVHAKVRMCMVNYIENRYGEIDADNFGECGTTTFERLKVMAIRYDLISATTGISCNLFTITRSFFKSSIGAFVTYALIIVQMPGTPKT